MADKFEWTVREQGDANEFCIFIDKGDKWLISFRLNGEMRADEQREIAAKISAVPDLISALKRVRDAGEKERGGWSLSEDDPYIYDAIDQALEKAGFKA